MRFASTWLSVLGLVTACSSRSAPPGAALSSAPTTTGVASTPSPTGATTGPELLETSAGRLEVHPVHHATVWMRGGDHVVWIDPTSEGSLEGPKADVVLITHEHHDHFDPAAIDRVKKEGTRVVGPASIADGLPGLVVMKNGDQRDEAGFAIEAIPAYNLVRGPEQGKLFHPKGRDNGYVVSFGGKRVYFSGDTECTDEMKALTSIDLAFVCMNLPYTMPTSEAAACVKAFKPKVLVPYHYRGQSLDDLDAPLAGSGVAIHKHVLY